MAEPTNPFDLSALPFGKLGPMLESVELFNKTWSSLTGIPNRLMPTVDIDELQKRITELKAVEQWLNLNLNVLRNTIQGMEMQRDALSAVKAFETPRNEASTESEPKASTAWAKASETFKASFQSASPPPNTDPEKAPSNPFSGFKNPFEGFQSTAAAASTGEAPPPLNPSVWWEMVQSNFTQVAEAALSSMARPHATAAAAEPAPAPPAEEASAPSENAPEPDPEPESDFEPETRAEPPQPSSEYPRPPLSPRPFKPVPLVRPSRTPRTSR